ncbi:uncharacterized protein N7506_010493 [Penicillium brevicompactum]|uniref:uncharacterized protein n=1 Tax=Penicillium brevicompactum TaxID=5074 RepID=UPI00254130FB|nr:uncharacterized protein N7506_010493 [Penicillium brevicompactum]KAJ5327391.1 hypothetical protein N7506_010493 [Penicillium brevicompactum]
MCPPGARYSPGNGNEDYDRWSLHHIVWDIEARAGFAEFKDVWRQKIREKESGYNSVMRRNDKANQWRKRDQKREKRSKGGGMWDEEHEPPKRKREEEAGEERVR